MIAHVTAAALASENKSLAHPASVDSLPTSANQEDHVSMATFAARRPARHGGQHRGHRRDRAARRGAGHRFPPAAASSRAARGGARASIRAVAPHLDGDRYLALDIEAVTPLVRGGTFTRFCPEVALSSP